MVEVFKTDVKKRTQSKMLLGLLLKAYPLFKINFDLTDCDKVLRVEGDEVEAPNVITLLKERGFNCEPLD